MSSLLTTGDQDARPLARPQRKANIFSQKHIGSEIKPEPRPDWSSLGS